MATEGAETGAVARIAADGDDAHHQQQREEAYGCSRNSKRQRRLLNWRMDPGESHSDFIIEIVAAVGVDQGGTEDSGNKKDAPVDVYNVHKAFLNFGERSSQYFAALIASQTAESMNNKTRIQLDFEPAAKAFPILLDYIYGLDHGEPELTIENAGPLYYLADYFEVEILHPKILDFWEEKMEVDHLALCLKQAGLYHVNSLRKIVVKKCWKNIANVALNSALLEESDSKFWPAVKKEKDQSELGAHPHFFSLMAEFCLRRKDDDLDAQTFNELIYPYPILMPFDAAIKLLEVKKSIDPAAFPEDGTASAFQTDMLGALTRDWRLWKDSTNAQNLLKEISPVLFSLAMNMALELADEETKALEISNSGSRALPTTVSLAGAGITAVNGVYSRCDDFSPNEPKYVMKGCWEGCVESFFTIKVCWTGPTETPLWYISAKKEGDAKETDLYSSHLFNRELLSRLPRMKGWLCLQDLSTDSPPALTYGF